MNRPRKAWLLVVLATAAMAVAALPALADSGTRKYDRTMETTPPGGKATLQYRNGLFKLMAHDVKKDGYRVNAYAADRTFTPRGQRLVAKRHLASAVRGNGTESDWRSFRVPRDKKVFAQVCLRDHDGKQHGHKDLDVHCGRITEVPKR